MTSSTLPLPPGIPPNQPASTEPVSNTELLTQMLEMVRNQVRAELQAQQSGPITGVPPIQASHPTPEQPPVGTSIRFTYLVGSYRMLYAGLCGSLIPPVRSRDIVSWRHIHVHGCYCMSPAMT